MKLARIEVDVAKQVFQVHGGRCGQPIWRQSQLNLGVELPLIRRS
jgi:hypothetical protein